MYMPLCRSCHERESRLNQQNAFVGDPQHVDLVAENKVALSKQDWNKEQDEKFDNADPISERKQIKTKVFDKSYSTDDELSPSHDELSLSPIETSISTNQ